MEMSPSFFLVEQMNWLDQVSTRNQQNNYSNTADMLVAK